MAVYLIISFSYSTIFSGNVLHHKHVIGFQYESRLIVTDDIVHIENLQLKKQKRAANTSAPTWREAEIQRLTWKINYCVI